jgi:hypothetical protein
LNVVPLFGTLQFLHGFAAFHLPGSQRVGDQSHQDGEYDDRPAKVLTDKIVDKEQTVNHYANKGIPHSIFLFMLNCA